jgi:phospholipid N-methyltransferase
VLPAWLDSDVIPQKDWPALMVALGTGILEAAGVPTPDARLLALELNGRFVEFLKDSVPDARLEVLHESAERVAELLEARGRPADYVISGIPFSTMPREVRASILARTRAALAPGGAFLVYQFSGRVLPHLRAEFGRVDRGFAPLNVLPARVFRCRVDGRADARS